tara:strand:- start:14016 stop:15305 length:1290 start_codon:yes stop_codon:yes gene_type:complete
MALLNQTQQQYYQGSDFGNYQFIPLSEVINQFMVVYVGEEKIINKARKVDVQFHAMRAMQELSFDTFKSIKSQEITVPPALSAVLPQDYVNYVKLSWTDSAGIMHVIYPTKYTKNPEPILQNEQGEYKLQAIGTMTDGSTTIVLNKEYKNILVGMVVSAPNVPVGSTVTSVTNNSSITTIVISSAATYTGDETLTFTNTDGSLIFEEESAFILEDLTIVSGSNKITANSTADARQIKVGMLVSSIDFAVGTTVIDVNGAVITTSENATTVSTEATFLSNKKISQTLSNYRSYSASDNTDRYDDGTYDLVVGERYGLNPEQAQVNGTFYISNGYIYFSSNISGKNVIIDYISDGLGTDEEMQVHKLAEEAMYRYIAHAILAGKANVPEYIVNRFKKEKFAAIRQAKLRLSNIKLEEITQVLRNKSKWIKH